MNRYVVYCHDFGYFKAGRSKSLYYNETDFVKKSEDAHWYRKKENAMKTACALGLHDFNKNGCEFRDVEVTEITITICESVYADKAITIMQAEWDKSKALFDEVSNLDYRKKEDLSDKKWKEFLDAKNFIYAYSDRFESDGQ